MNRDLFSMRVACLEVFSRGPGVAVNAIPGVDSHCSVQTSTVVTHLSFACLKL